MNLTWCCLGEREREWKRGRVWGDQCGKLPEQCASVFEILEETEWCAGEILCGEGSCRFSLPIAGCGPKHLPGTTSTDGRNDRQGFANRVGTPSRALSGGSRPKPQSFSVAFAIRDHFFFCIIPWLHCSENVLLLRHLATNTRSFLIKSVCETHHNGCNSISAMCEYVIRTVSDPFDRVRGYVRKMPLLCFIWHQNIFIHAGITKWLWDSHTVTRDTSLSFIY